MSDINMGDWADEAEPADDEEVVTVGDLLAEYEAEHGEITDEELAEYEAEVVELNAPLAKARDTDGQPGDNLYFLVDEDGNVLDALRRDVAWGIELQDGQRIVESIDYTTVAFDED